MEKQTVNHITLEDQCFVRFSPNVTIFGVHEKNSTWWNGRLGKIHFSISHRQDRDEINFHVTRNFKDHDDKPKIVIFKIAKSELNALATIAAENMLVQFLKPLKVFYNRPPYKKEQDKNRRFFSFKVLDEHNKESNLYQGYKDTFNKVSYIKKKRHLRIRPSFQHEFKGMASSGNFRDEFYRNLRPARQRLKKGAQAGILISDNDQVPVIVIGQKFYTFQYDRSPFEFLAGMLGEPLAKKILLKILFAIARVAKAETYADTKMYNEPIILTLV